MASRSPSPAVMQLAEEMAGTGSDLAVEIAGWLHLPRFRSFAHAYRDKIAKKLRSAGSEAAREDVRAELLVARLLLSDRHFELVFEPGRQARGGPDFAVLHRGGRAFNVEVTRPRRVGGTEPARPILTKLRQLPTGAPNLLLVVMTATPSAWDMSSAVRGVRALADAKREDYFVRRGFAGTRDFYDRFLRLGAVIAWSPPRSTTAGDARAWTNNSARIPISDRELRACLAALRTSP